MENIPTTTISLNPVAATACPRTRANYRSPLPLLFPHFLQKLTVFPPPSAPSSGGKGLPSSSTGSDS